MAPSPLSTGNSLLDHVILWAVILSALGGGAAVIKSHVLPFFRALSNFLSDWTGEPARAGVPERLGVMARLEEQDEQMRKVRHELHPNGGTSMRDAVDRVDEAAKVAAVKATKAAEMAETAAQVATANKAALDAHIKQADAIVEQGAADKAALWLNAEKNTAALSEMAKAVQLAAQSTPPHEEDE
jgi:hypothetical protein